MDELNLVHNKKAISPIERIADYLCVDKNKAENDNILCLLIQDKITELKQKNNKDNLEKLKYKSMYEQSIKHKNKEVVHKNADVEKYEKENIRLKKINLELNTALEGLKNEIKSYKKERISRIIGYTTMNKKDEEYLL